MLGKIWIHGNSQMLVMEVLIVTTILENNINLYSLNICLCSYATPMTQQFHLDQYSLLLLLSHFSHVQLCVTPETAAHQAPLSLGFSRQEHWSGLPFPSPMHESEKWKWSRSSFKCGSGTLRLFQGNPWGQKHFSNIFERHYLTFSLLSHKNTEEFYRSCVT